MATQEIINIGALPNDGTGDPLRVAFDKINNNFSNLFPTSINSSSSYSVGNAAGQLIFETPANTFTSSQIVVYTADTQSNSSQSMNLNVLINQELDDVKFTASSTVVFGDPLSLFDMRVAGGNVQLLANPFDENTVLFHFIGSQILWAGANVQSLIMGLDGYVNSGMATENDIFMVTEQSE